MAQPQGVITAGIVARLSVGRALIVSTTVKSYHFMTKILMIHKGMVTSGKVEEQNRLLLKTIIQAFSLLSFRTFEYIKRLVNFSVLIHVVSGIRSKFLLHKRTSLYHPKNFNVNVAITVTMWAIYI